MPSPAKFALALLAAIFLAFAPVAAAAQPMPPGFAVVGGSLPISATGSSARTAFPAAVGQYGVLTFYNKSAVDAWVAVGNSSVVATTSSTSVPAGGSVTLSAVGTTYVAAITGGSSASLVLWQSSGPINFISSGSGSFSLSGSLPAGLANIGTVGGLEFNASVIPTVQNAAYAAGQSLGGLQTISIGSTNGLTGILSQIQAASKGGSTVAVAAYAWDKNPTNTTCTDKTNFVVSQTDNQHLIVAPQSLSLATAVSAQDASTYGAASGLAANFVNGSADTNIYVCLLASAAVTPATTTDYRINIQGIKDAP